MTNVTEGWLASEKRNVVMGGHRRGRMCFSGEKGETDILRG